jgi:glycosyltransferase involved in cell wall biosynthesis
VPPDEYLQGYVQTYLKEAVSIKQPRISIVMPCFQQAPYLAEAVRSVLDQKGVAVELLVMDPGSTDGSRELLARMQVEYGDRLRLILEPDDGQSDAVNRGMALARGRVLGWLNSDDRMRPDALAGIANLLDHDQPGWVYGQAGMINERGAPVSSFIARYKNWRGRRFSRLKLLTENFIPQMSVFWNRSLWERAGGLDTANHLAMDYDLWLRFSRIVEPVVLPFELADFRVHGQAKGSRQTSEQLTAACVTARRHAVEHGFKGQLAVALHRLLALRTRLVYMLLKPK